MSIIPVKSRWIIHIYLLKMHRFIHDWKKSYYFLLKSAYDQIF